MSNIKVMLLNRQIEWAAESFFRMIDGLDNSVLHTQPGGRANSISATIGHVFTATDTVLNVILKNSPPLFQTMNTGLSEPPPSGEEFFHWHAWGARIQLDLPTALPYGKAVFADVAAYLGTLDDSDLDQVIATPIGEHERFVMVHGAILNNIITHTGEISTLKGLQGIQGYAF